MEVLRLSQKRFGDRIICAASTFRKFHLKIEKNAVASVAVTVFKDESLREVALCLRRNEPKANFWSLPGGRIERGEASAHAAMREIKEETSLIVSVSKESFFWVTDVIYPQFHYLLSHAVAIASNPCDLWAADDASAAKWLTFHQIQELIDQGLAIFNTLDVICKARQHCLKLLKLKTGLRLLVVHDSDNRRPRQVAEEIARGAVHSQLPLKVHVSIKEFPETGEEDLLRADAVILGFQAQSAGIPLQVEEFLSYLELQAVKSRPINNVKGKLGGVFCCGTQASQDDYGANYLIISAMLGVDMLVAGVHLDRHGDVLGSFNQYDSLRSQKYLNSRAKQTAELFGAKVARHTLQSILGGCSVQDDFRK